MDIAKALNWILKFFPVLSKLFSTTYQQDQERFNKVISCCDPITIDYFYTQKDYIEFSSFHSEQIIKITGELELIQQFEKFYKNKKLQKLEQEFLKAANIFSNSIALKSYFKNGSTLYRTIYQKNINGDEKFEKINNELISQAETLHESFISYKRYGDKLFAVKRNP